MLSHWSLLHRHPCMVWRRGGPCRTGFRWPNLAAPSRMITDNVSSPAPLLHLRRASKLPKRAESTLTDGASRWPAQTRGYPPRSARPTTRLAIRCLVPQAQRDGPMARSARRHSCDQPPARRALGGRFECAPAPIVARRSSPSRQASKAHTENPPRLRHFAARFSAAPRLPNTSYRNHLFSVWRYRAIVRDHEAE
jgi:hypothetical protein